MRTFGRFVVHAIALLLAFGAALDAQALARRVEPALPGIDSLVAAEFAKDSIGSITVGVVAGGDLVWTKSYGFANVASRKLADRNTVYRIGSITKPFTAVMLMQLEQAGRVRLADPVEKFFPEIRQVGGLPAGASPPTLLQLATMTGGLAREPREEGPFWSGPVSKWEETLIAALPHTSYAYMPGGRFLYSNIGYAILGATLGRAAGVPYTTWERTHVFEPLGMTHTRFEIDGSIAANVATGYDVSRDGALDSLTPAKEGREGRGYKVPNGAIFTTVDDMSRFVAFELGHGPAGVLPPARLDSAFGGVVASSADLGSGYGLGFMALRRQTLTFTGHGGAVAGYLASMYFSRPAQVGVVLFRNVTGGKVNPDRLAVDILSRLVESSKQHRAVAIDPKAFDAYVGRYQMPGGAVMTVTRENERFLTQVGGQPRFEILPEGDRDFFVKAFDAQVSFVTDSRGKATELIVHQGGESVHAKRIE
ncbi:MAG TPA: serine hydrolase [Gemmatimonadaceae bacterium]|jgi:D-alanyl-D-alanine carboxypeptidase|nr:serine hydrolase [Gemmatimonadaceae bacterium]